MLLFTAATGLLIGIVFGLAPAIQASQTYAYETMKEGGRSGGDAPRTRGRALLVVGQVAVATLLLVGAGLLTKSLSPRDALVFAGAPLLLAVTALAACLLPAWRATRIDPVVVIRADG